MNYDNKKFDVLVSEIISNVNFRNGVIHRITGKERTCGLILKVEWKRNISLVIYGFGGRIICFAAKNGERVSLTCSLSQKYKQDIFDVLNHLAGEIENGDFDNKKTKSDIINEIISERHLTSCMNNTKWKEFVHAMTEEMPIEIPFGYKTLFEEKGDEVLCVSSFDAESFNGYDFKSLEWVKLKPKFFERRHRGMLLDDEMIPVDEEAEFVELMRKYSIPVEYDEKEEIYIIYGYK